MVFGCKHVITYKKTKENKKKNRVCPLVCFDNQNGFTENLEICFHKIITVWVKYIVYNIWLRDRGVNGSDISRFYPDPNPENYLNYPIRIRIRDYPYPYPKNYNG